jgi:hypothetical protein
MEKSDTLGLNAEDKAVSQSDGNLILQKSRLGNSMEISAKLNKDLVMDPGYPSQEILIAVAEALLDGFIKK